ncbi:MAG TPA: hypothetical protein PKD85_21195 [Saprospiraceae bacterium]|nr:hypothetical protein [Saprospiraceae bacterium]
MNIKHQILTLTISMILCIIIAGFFPSSSAILIAVIVSSLSLITLVYRILKDQSVILDNKDDQMSPP